MFDLVPKVKIIALLRNPTERAISHYFHEKRKNREPLSIYEALQAEEKRLEAVLRDKNYKSESFIHHSYKSRGLYKEQLERYLDYFPREQILVLSSDELFNEPNDILKRVFDFVGVNTEFKVDKLKARNVGSNRVELDPKIYHYLNDYFFPHNQELYKLIGKSYDW